MDPITGQIDVAKVYLPVLDEVYQQECKTAILEGDESTVKMNGFGELMIAKLEMDGLGAFDRNSGYTKGSTKLTWETVKYDMERSQELRIDRLNQREALDVAFGKLAGEFIRTKVSPETDAARIAKMYGTQGVSLKEESIETGEQAVKALRAASDKMDQDEVPAENRILFINSTLLSAIEDLDTTKSKRVLERFSRIIPMPARRMYTKINLYDGKEKYGYDKADDAHDGNFVVVEKSAFVAALDQWIKYFTPEQDQIADDHVFKYRSNNLYGYAYENKLAGIYGSYAPISGGQ